LTLPFAEQKMVKVSDYSEVMVTTYQATYCYNKVDHNLKYLRLKGYGCVADVGDEAAKRHITVEAAIFF
jgi:hypothetical protein